MGIYTKIIDMQKLRKAWEKVKKNKPACGADQITCEDFDRNLKENLYQLHLELAEKRYQPGLVKLIKLSKNGKERAVSLCNMRDKIVQRSIADELNKIYEPLFSKNSYAYRQGMSAIQAVEKIEKNIRLGNYTHYVKGDIEKFFDNIPFSGLREDLEKKIQEREVLDLIFCCLAAGGIDDQGKIIPKEKGIYQGSILAPVLSNIYLLNFDYEMEGKKVFYLRYSDDCIALCENLEGAGHILKELSSGLQRLELSLNTEKSCVGKIEDGFQFLGYEFSKKGMKIPKKAKEHLENSIENIWLEDNQISFGEKLEKAVKISTGWEQYYRGERKTENIFIYLILVYQAEKNGEDKLDELKESRRSLHNDYYDVCCYLASWWKEKEQEEMRLFEYEDYYGWHISDAYPVLQRKRKILDEIFIQYERLGDDESEENLIEIMQLYADAGLYSVADMVDSYMKRKNWKPDEKIIVPAQPELQGKIQVRDFNLFMNLFAGREDMYAEEKEINGHRKYEPVMQPLTLMEIRSQLAGERTIATYVQRSNATAHFLVLDIDISKKVLLTHTEEKDFRKYYKAAGEYVKKVLDILKQMGIMGYPEESGYRGYHVWIFCKEWISVRYINLLSDCILKRIPENEDIQVEMFPNKTHLKAGRAGQAIKLPYGLHTQTGRQGYLCERDLSRVDDIDAYMKGIVSYSLNEIKRMIGKAAGYQEKEKTAVPLILEATDLTGLNSGIIVVLQKCNLMRYLYCKAKRTGYLNHGERLSVLYVFGHLGAEGKEFVHRVMEFTMNYQYHVTQHFIERLLEKPISCTKLRENYQKITAEYGCSCNFKRSRNCYPSPVLHAAKISDEEKLDVTVPVSRKISKEKEDKIREELNLPRTVLLLAKKLQELKKQKRGIEKAVHKTEMELMQIFDSQEVDCMEIDLGLLCRRKAEGGTEWFIEL